MGFHDFVTRLNINYGGLFEVEGGMNLFVLLAFISLQFNLSLGTDDFISASAFSQCILSGLRLCSIILTMVTVHIKCTSDFVTVNTPVPVQGWGEGT